MYIPKNKPSHPGEFIRENVVKEFAVTQDQLAKAIGVSRKTVNELINGKRSMTVDMALRISRYTNTDSGTWMNLQIIYDIWEALHSEKGKSIQSITPIGVVA